MAAQYDDFAEKYQRIVTSPILMRGIRILDYTFMRLVGDISGKSVLDLACGAGDYTRKLKQAGASHTVGVDISEEMIKLARKQEAQAPLGIEYILSDAQELGKIGDFDLVTAAHYLHYAPTKEQLLKFCQTPYDNLKPGQRFITVIGNPETKGPEYPFDAYKKYGLSRFKVAHPLHDGALIKITIAAGGEEVEFDNYYHSKETYEWALRAAGFKTINWHKLILPLEVEQEDDREFWDFYLEAPLFAIIECQK
jgi:ubiquinone/menaquinone biosynthesis C-methylase UbiE